MKNKIGVSVGRDEKVRETNASMLPDKSVRVFRSKEEQKVIELLESKHPVPPAKWAKLKPEERQILKEVAMDRDHPMRTKAITSLVLSNEKNHEKLLEEIISNRKEDNLVRAVAAISLGMSKSPEAGHALVKFIRDEDEFVRAKVVEALGKVGGKEDVYAVKQAAVDKSPLVRSNAEDATNMIDFRLGRLRKQKQERSK
jgi:HEAT repeat protein